MSCLQRQQPVANLSNTRSRLEDGRAALSTVKGSWPPEALRTKHALNIMTMPATYSAEAATKNAIRIMKDEMRAIRSYVALMGNNLPASGGWDRLPR